MEQRMMLISDKTRDGMWPYSPSRYPIARPMTIRLRPDMVTRWLGQWGLARQQSNGSWVPGPNLRHTLFDDAITTSDPNREDSVTVGGIASLNGKAIRAQLRTDVPRAPRTPTPGVTIHNTYKQLWHYTFGNTQWIRLSGFAEWRLTNLNRTYDVLHRHSGKAVMVYTNLQQSTIVGCYRNW